MRASTRILYIKSIIKGFISAIPSHVLLKLYEKHKIQVNKRNIQLVKEFRGKPYSATSYFKQPAPNIEAFKIEYLNSIIVLKLMNSTENKYLQHLQHHEIAYLLDFRTYLTSVEIEQRVQRILKRPKNIQVIDNLKQTYRDITFKSNLESTSF